MPIGHAGDRRGTFRTAAAKEGADGWLANPSGCDFAGVKLLLTEGPDDILKARLPLHVGHPRALLTCLEGLALWCGARLTAVIAADDPGCWCPTCVGRRPGSGLFESSALVEFVIAVPDRVGHRSRVWAFARLRRLASWE